MCHLFKVSLFFEEAWILFTIKTKWHWHLAPFTCDLPVLQPQTSDFNALFLGAKINRALMFSRKYVKGTIILSPVVHQSIVLCSSMLWGSCRGTYRTTRRIITERECRTICAYSSSIQCVRDIQRARTDFSSFSSLIWSKRVCESLSLAPLFRVGKTRKKVMKN